MLDNVTNSEKWLYNTFLITARKAKNKPFKVRKDFSEMDSSNLLFLRKLKIFFNKFSWVDPEIYFRAPYEIYPDEEWFGLDYYITQKAIKAYTLYMKKLRIQSPTTDEQLEFIKKSLKYITEFCVKEKITLKEYIIERRGISYEWMRHIAKNYISIYIIMGFPNIFDMVTGVPKDESELLLGDFIKEFGNIKQRYEAAPKAKNMVENGLILIEKFINNNIKTVDKNK